jgi:hypothetical protein
MLKMRVLTQFKYVRAFCLASSVSACFASSAQAASFAGDLTLEVLYPQNLPNGVSFGVNNRILATGTPEGGYASGNGQGSFRRDANNVISGETVSGSTDPIVPDEARADIDYSLRPNATNNTDSVVTIPFTVNYKYNISSSVSGSGIDNSSLQVGIQPGTASSVPIRIDDSVTDNGSKEGSGTFNRSVTLNPHSTALVIDEYFGQLSGRANTAVAVPTPSSALSTLAFGAVSAGYLLKRQLKKQKSASGDKSVV